MNWLTSYVRPKLQGLVGKKSEVPDNLWRKCSDCEQMIFHRDFQSNLYVCPHCDHHERVSALSRLEMLYDDGQFTLVPLPDVTVDPLKFKDTKKYIDRLKAYQEKNNSQDAVLVAYGTIGGKTVVTAAFDFFFMGGSMGMAAGEAIVQAAEVALKFKAPLLTIPASGGARMQEGILSLMQLPRTIIAVQMVREAKLPYLVLLADPTTGGVSASFAMLGDIALAEPKATIGFAGRRVIEDIIREKLPENFQSSEYLLEHGMVDMVVHRKDLRATLSKIVRLIQT
jgi:acetyl-CoA carboxylase carboxyl transferase subunit beta